MKTIKFLFILFLAVISLGSFAQNNDKVNALATPPPAQLIQLIRKSFDFYPKLKQSAEYIKLTQEQNTMAKAGYIPTIAADATYRYAKPTPELSFPGGAGTFRFVPDNNYDVHLGVNIPIWDFGRTQASVKKTLLDIQVAKDNFDDAKQLLAGQVAQLYFAIVLQNRAIAVENEQLMLLGQNEKLISDRVKDGDALKFDLLSTQVKKNTAQNTLIDLEANRKKQYDMLNMLTGSEGYEYITRADSNPDEIPTGDPTPDANFNLISLNDQLKATEWDIKAARRSWLPNLSGRAQAGTQNGYVPDVNKMAFAYSAGVGLNIPIYGANRPNLQIKMAKINLQAAKYNLEAQKNSISKDILQIQADIVANQSKIKNYELQIDLAKEALNLANIRYKAGIITSLEQLTAQTNLQDAELGKIQLDYNLIIAKIQMLRTSGKTFW